MNEKAYSVSIRLMSPDAERHSSLDLSSASTRGLAYLLISSFTGSVTVNTTHVVIADLSQ